MRTILSDLLGRALCGSYADIRYERRHVTEVTIDHRGLDLRSQRKVGGVCRTFGTHATGQYVFSDPAQAPTLLRDGRRSLSLAGKRRPVAPLPAPDACTVCLPGALTARLDERMLPVLRHYVDLARGFRAVSHVALYCRLERCHKYFANSLGRYIEQAQQSLLCVLSLTVGAQSAIEVMSTVDGPLLEDDARVEALGRFAETLTGARPVVKGRYTVVLDPQLAGAVVHETVGHVSEADNAPRSRSIRSHFRVGRRVAPPGLTVVDDATIPRRPGSYAFDDEGVAASRTTLIADGIVAGRLHSLTTARDARVAPTGNGRAADFGCEPIVRCSNTMVLPGPSSTDELIASTDEGLYLRGVRGGHTKGDAFSYAACGGWRIRRGRLAEPIGNLTMRGGVPEFLGGITGVGDTLPPFSSPFCLKQGQPWLPVWSASPALKVTGVRLEV